MSSLVKWQYIENSESDRLLDSNTRIRERLEAYQRDVKKKRDQMYREAIDDFYAAITTDEEGNTVLPTDENGRVPFPLDEEGRPLVVIDEEGNIVTVDNSGEESDEDAGDAEPVVDIRLLEQAREEAEVIVTQAQSEADEILENARAEAEAMKSHYAEEGKKEGYRDGTGQAMQEVAAKEAEFNQELDRMAAAYRAKEEQLERIITDGVCDLMEKFFNVQFGDSKELLYHLVDNCVLHIESSHQFLIKVNDDGFATLNEKKDELQSAVGADAQLDIVRDPVLSEGQCIIETDGGVFDCSLDTELRNLIKDIKSLNI
ncbi:MAG: hypothetical protein K6B14_06245 [Lachnospiraceae bacterium]|nr:hypothetical protein [Lachnospiraceae bacterium]